MLRQIGIRLIVPGYGGKSDTAAAAGYGDLFDAIGPVTCPAEQAHDHQPRVRHHVFDIQINGHVMTQLEKIRETQARCIGTCPRLRARERGKFGIGRRQKDDVARCLA